MISKSVSIKGTPYTLYINYQDDKQKRKEFNRMCQEVWEFDFEAFYQSGYWGEECILFSLFQEDKIVAHITLSLFEITKENKTYKAGQLGTVMTDSTYQNKGLSRFLLEYIEAEYRDIVTGYFLFANDTVLDFYPKFGYVPVEEYQATLKVNTKYSLLSSIEKLDLDNPASLALFKEYVKSGYTYNRLNTKNVDLAFFYCYADYDFSFKNAIHYSKALDTIIIYEQEESELTIYSIYQRDHHVKQLDAIIDACCTAETQTINFAFSPEAEQATYSLYKEDDDITLMVTKELIDLFSDQKTMVASLSHT
ncbi:GNAT family N-acetyltransferase [Myroides albus]|uniref:GNAT family N-acetyltransferase n=1 Tax=Myroides albus TaxID=2562892 RepID=A0A6I3LTW1_9FLAO|nr:GNAT family N-acetyltransferase [Myroides albus]MTG99382.1 GNAT family N-acetyltransferase [Myroides albus]UVD80179.1 GNAT family N-acetyltransferase [Myroides albus]